MCICCRGTEKFHGQTKCVPSNGSFLSKLSHIDYTKMKLLNVFYSGDLSNAFFMII